MHILALGSLASGTERSIHSTMITTCITVTTFAGAAYDALADGRGYVLAVVTGCSHCDQNPDQCEYTVGPGRPNEAGETTLDALIMDGVTHDAGAVGCLKGVQRAAEVAYYVMMTTGHTLLVGDDATQFALDMGFELRDLETDQSREQYEQWRDNDCQPNHRKNVLPDPTENCGPYTPAPELNRHMRAELDSSSEDNHDTIGMVVVDDDGNVAAGTSANGLQYKVPGRVGDSPIPGAGAYADADVGGAAATGNGDIMMRFLPSKMAVHYMSSGSSPAEAALQALTPIAQKYPDFDGAIIVLNKQGEYGISCYGYNSFPFAIRQGDETEARVETVPCFTL